MTFDNIKHALVLYYIFDCHIYFVFLFADLTERVYLERRLFFMLLRRRLLLLGVPTLRDRKKLEARFIERLLTLRVDLCEPFGLFNR